MQDKSKCEWCTKPFVKPPSAPHKRFCSDECRNKWHGAETAKAKALMAKLRLQDGALKELIGD
jgi:hypothetical protein